MISGAARFATEKAVFRPALPMSFSPGISEMQMATMTYKEQLLHPNWQRKRLEILSRDEFACKLCYDTESTLHVHHKQYAKGRMAWEYPDDELVTLCEDCHETMHEQNAMLRDVTAKLPVDGPGCVSNATAILAGWAHGSQGMNFDHVFEDNPHSFVAGEVAAALEDKLNLDHLMGLLATASASPRWVLHQALAEFVATCEARKDDPPPESYTRAFEL